MKTNLHEVNKGFKIIGNWPHQAIQLKESYQQLKNEDLIFETGRENDMLQRLEDRLDKRRNEIIDIIRKNATKMSDN
jgi:hypothetical protein